MTQEPKTPLLNSLSAVPNLLTLARITIAPFLVAELLDGNYRKGFWLFFAAGLTDALDGTLARVLKQKTQLGQYLDPVADKLLLSTIFVVLTHQRLIPMRVTVLVFSRDVAILVVAALLYAAVGWREFKPSIFGKANTVVQLLAVAFVLLSQLTKAAWVAQGVKLSLGATVALTVFSGLHYAWVAAGIAGRRDQAGG